MNFKELRKRKGLSDMNDYSSEYKVYSEYLEVLKGILKELEE